MNSRLVSMTLSSLFLISCGGGGGERLPVSRWCSPTYEAMNFEPGTATETADLTENEPVVIKDGTFVSQEHDIFYRDITNDIRLHVRATYTINEESGKADTSTEVLCSGGRGLGINGKPMRYQLPFVHRVIVQGGKTLVSSGTYIFEIQNKPNTPRLTTTILLDDKSVDGSLKTGIPEETIDTLMFYKFPNENFELRGKLADLSEEDILASSGPGYEDNGQTCEPTKKPQTDEDWRAVVDGPPEVFIRINYEEFVEEDEEESNNKPTNFTIPESNKSVDK